MENKQLKEIFKKKRHVSFSIVTYHLREWHIPNNYKKKRHVSFSIVTYHLREWHIPNNFRIYVEIEL